MTFLLKRRGAFWSYERMSSHLMKDGQVFATPPEVTSYVELAERRAAELFEDQG